MAVPTAPCIKCEGTGYIKKYDWNKGGVCFECGGDGKVTTFSTIKLNRMTMKSEMRDYITHSSNRDIASIFADGGNFKLKETQHIEMRRELRDRAIEFYGMNPDSYGSTKELGKAVLDELTRREKAIPDTYKKSPYYSAGKISLVPVHWLKKFQGNPLRRDDDEMQDFAEQLQKEGLKDPVMIIIGQQDRRVSVGEGNHRMNAFIKAGLDYVPARVSRQQRNDGRGTYYYDKMERVPSDDYFKADASPEEVFDTFQDKGEYPPEPVPSELDGHRTVTESFLEARNPSMFATEEDIGVDISNIDLKEHGIRELWVKEEADVEDDTETLKGLIAHYLRVYGERDDVLDFLTNDGILHEGDSDKLGSYRFDRGTAIAIFESLSSYKDGEFAPKKSASEEYDELMELLDLDWDDDDI
jgi:hypothetical protein